MSTQLQRNVKNLNAATIWRTSESYLQLLHNQYLFKTMANTEWDITKCVKVWRGLSEPTKRIQHCHCRSPVCLWRTSTVDKRWAPAPFPHQFWITTLNQSQERRARIMWQGLSHSLPFDAWGRLNQSNPCHKPAHRPRHKENMRRQTNRQTDGGLQTRWQTKEHQRG